MKYWWNILLCCQDWIDLKNITNTFLILQCKHRFRADLGFQVANQMLCMLVSLDWLPTTPTTFRKPLNPKLTGGTTGNPALWPLWENTWPIKYFLFFSSGNYHLLLRKLLSGGCWAGSEIPWLQSKLNSHLNLLFLFTLFFLQSVYNNLYFIFLCTPFWHLILFHSLS